MKKILVNSNRIHGSALAKKIAEQDQEITVDLIGAPMQAKLPGNFNYLGNHITWKERFDRLKEIYHTYDFIYATDMIFQLSEDFHDWKSRIDIPILCPDKECGFLEFSKCLSKQVLTELDIPTPKYQVLKMNEWGMYNNIHTDFLNSEKFVMKLDKSFISTGRQTMIANKTNYKKFMHWHFEYGHVGSYIVEEFLRGNELSCHFLCNGTEWVYLGSARDYKKEYENDSGQNCSSTGSYSFNNILEPSVAQQIFSYVTKILSYMNKNSKLFRGIMYLGVLIDQDKIPHILEINTRPGNPEFNVILETIESNNLLENLVSASIGNTLSSIKFNNDKVSSVNLLSKDYMNPKIINDEELLNFNPEFSVSYYFPKETYHHKLFCNVLCKGDSIEKSSKKIFDYLKDHSLKNYRFRTDIGILP